MAAPLTHPIPWEGVNPFTKKPIKSHTREPPPDAGYDAKRWRKYMRRVRGKASEDDAYAGFDWPHFTIYNIMAWRLEPLARVPTGRQFLQESRDWLVKEKATVLRADGPRTLQQAPRMLENFTLDVEANRQRFQMNYFVIQQAAGGGTIAARLQATEFLTPGDFRLPFRLLLDRSRLHRLLHNGGLRVLADRRPALAACNWDCP